MLMRFALFLTVLLAFSCACEAQGQARADDKYLGVNFTTWRSYRDLESGASFTHEVDSMNGVHKHALATSVGLVYRERPAPFLEFAYGISLESFSWKNTSIVDVATGYTTKEKYTWKMINMPIGLGYVHVMGDWTLVYMATGNVRFPTTYSVKSAVTGGGQTRITTRDRTPVDKNPLVVGWSASADVTRTLGDRGRVRAGVVYSECSTEFNLQNIREYPKALGINLSLEMCIAKQPRTAWGKEFQ